MQFCRKPVRTCQLICSLLGQKSNDDDHVTDMGLGMLSMHTKNDSKSVLKARDTHRLIFCGRFCLCGRKLHYVVLTVRKSESLKRMRKELALHVEKTFSKSNIIVYKNFSIMISFGQNKIFKLMLNQWNIFSQEIELGCELNDFVWV